MENTEKEKPIESKRMILTEEDKQKLAKVIHGSEDEDEETEPIPAKKPRTETSNTNEKPGENVNYRMANPNVKDIHIWVSHPV